MKRSKSVFFALSNLTTLVLFVLLALVTVITVSSSGPVADNAVQPSVSESPVAPATAYSTPRRTSTGDPWFEPDTPVQVYTGSGEAGWQTVPYRFVPQGTEYLFEERLYYVDPEGRVAVNRQVTADAVSLVEANRVYQPDNWRWPEAEDLVRYVDKDNHHLRYDQAKRFKPGDRFWFQGVLYEGIPNPADPASRGLSITGYVLDETGEIASAEIPGEEYGYTPDEMLVSQAGLPAGVEAQSALPGVGSDVTDLDFTGKRLESFGLLDYDARYYDPMIGRFISPDTIVPDYTNPQTLDRYSYALNNPVRFTDPSGHIADEGGAAGGGGAGLIWAALAVNMGEYLANQTAQVVMQTAPYAQQAAQNAELISQFAQQTDAARRQPADNAGNSNNADPNNFNPNKFDPNRDKNLTGQLRKIMDKHPIESGYCDKCANQVFNKLSDAGYNTEIVRFEYGENVTARFMLLRDGNVVASTRGATLAYHEFVRVGDRVFDTLTGPEGMVWDDYLQLWDPYTLQLVTETVTKSAQ